MRKTEKRVFKKPHTKWKTRIKVALFLLILTVLFGFACAFYPLFATNYTKQTQSVVKTEYEDVVEQMDEVDLSAMREEAEEWNERYAEACFAEEEAEHVSVGSGVEPSEDSLLDRLDPEGNGYYDILNVTKTGDLYMMGYVRIPKIGIELPIYHGISDSALSAGAGHLPQSSFPIGGENTHAVISAHCGMASSLGFTDLELMEVGDYFFIDILGETLTYQVDQISIVEPEDIEQVQVVRNEDYVTLVTCTPYGINSHRLLVRGTRVENLTDDEVDRLVQIGPLDSVWMQKYLIGLLLGLVFAVIFIIGSVVVQKVRKRKC